MNKGEMRARVRYLIDEPTETFWLDVELDTYIDAAYNYYYQDLLNANYDGIEAAPTNLNIVSGTSTVALPSDFAKARMLERVFSTQTVPLRYVERQEEANIITPMDSSYYLPIWSIIGSNINLEPTPPSSWANGLKLWYFPIPTPMTADAHTPDSGFRAMWHDLIPLRAAVMAKEGKEEADASGILKILQPLETMFHETLSASTTITRQYVTPFGLTQ